MNRKRWALLILAVILILSYIKLFYKTYSEENVARSADCIAILDVKRITNTLIWQYLTTPSQWKAGKLFPKKSDQVDWKDMFELPDFIFVFHSKGQPVNNWYCLLTIKDRKTFEKGLAQLRFEKINGEEYLNKAYGLRLMIHDKKVLAGTGSISGPAYFSAVANELFNQKNFVQRSTLASAIQANSHLAVYIAPNDLLADEAVITANFNKKKIEITSLIKPRRQYTFTENNFKYAAGSLCTTGFTQPSPGLYGLLGDRAKQKISTALNFNIDSILLQGNKYYSLNIPAIKQRADSAVSYSFDDEFNKVEKIV
ncbi:MAG TPA: hypothetical protein VHL77_03030, partial [Ferruginibacter sp.]|nr:hypothetical protein [Ferruginibacter sp.]